MLADQLENQGAWLFRWRSYLPLALVGIVAAALLQFHYPFDSEALDEAREAGCLAVALAGLGLRVLTVGFVPRGTSGRNTKAIKASVLNRTGMYSIVRHPLYLANFVIFAAFLLDVGEAWLALCGSLAYWLYYERIILAEEAFLLKTHGEEFRRWAEVTPAAWPRLRLWRRPVRRFSWISTLRREYTTLFLIVCLFTAVEVGGDLVLSGRLTLSRPWAMLFFSTAAFYLGVRLLKKRTRLLVAAGR